MWWKSGMSIGNNSNGWMTEWCVFVIEVALRLKPEATAQTKTRKIAEALRSCCTAAPIKEEEERCREINAATKKGERTNTSRQMDRNALFKIYNGRIWVRIIRISSQEISSQFVKISNSSNSTTQNGPNELKYSADTLIKHCTIKTLEQSSKFDICPA